MIVSELIEHLKTLPQDVPVVYSLHSEFAVMDAADVRTAYLAVWNGEYMRPYERHWPDGKPVFATVVTFPGN